MTAADVLPGDVIVDNTILKSAICSTQVAMHHVLGLSTSEAGKELTAGSAAHEALAWWLCRQPVDKCLERFDEVYKEWSGENVPADDRLAWRPLRRILANWFAKHPLEKWQFVVKPEEVEVPMVAELGVIVDDTRVRERVQPKGQQAGETGSLVMVALLDAVGKMRTGGRWSIDHKTTGNTGDWFKDDQETSSQFTGQMWLARKLGIRLSGVYINAVHFKAIPGSDRRCSTHGTTYKECGLGHLEHTLFPVTRTEAEIDAWEVTARKLAAKFIRIRERVKTAEDVRELPMEGRFARMCSRCSFKDWCRQGRPAGAVRSFVKQQWNPLDHAQRHVDSLAGVRE